MKMTIKIKALIASVITILVCVAMIVGSTFALFTDEERVNINVNAATVEFISDIKNIRVTSMDDYVDDVPDAAGYYTFEVGGTATIDDEGNIIIDRMAPGDAVEIIIENDIGDTNIAICYRVRFSITVTDKNGNRLTDLEGEFLTDENNVPLSNDMLTAYVNTAPDAADPYNRAAMTVMTSGDDGDAILETNWSDRVSPEDEVKDIVIRFEMNERAGNEYQGVSIVAAIVIEAIQYNGVQ